MTVARCRHKKCRAPLRFFTNGTGTVQSVCEPCARVKAGRCRTETCRARVTGSAWYCTPCRKARDQASHLRWVEANPERYRAAVKRRRLARHRRDATAKERENAAARIYGARYRKTKRHRARYMAWYDTHKDAITAQVRAYYRANRAAIRASHAAYYRANKDVLRMKDKGRIHQKRQATTHSPHQAAA